MDNNHANPLHGIISTLISMSSATFCMISDIQSVATLIGSVIAIISGLFAIRYYYFATKKINKK